MKFFLNFIVSLFKGLEEIKVKYHIDPKKCVKVLFDLLLNIKAIKRAKNRIILIT